MIRRAFTFVICILLVLSAWRAFSLLWPVSPITAISTSAAFIFFIIGIWGEGQK